MGSAGYYPRAREERQKGKERGEREAVKAFVFLLALVVEEAGHALSNAVSTCQRRSEASDAGPSVRSPICSYFSIQNQFHASCLPSSCAIIKH